MPPSNTHTPPFMSLGIPTNFGMVAGVCAASFAVHHVYMALRVSNARKKYNVNVPDLYATSENCADPGKRHAYNCIQRAHQNCLENQPIFLAMMIAAGLKYPKVAAGAGAAYTLGALGYFLGYATGEPEKRQFGGYFKAIAHFVLAATCLRVGYKSLPDRSQLPSTDRK